MEADTPALILASTSPFRRELLTRLGLSFEAVAPEVDETRQAEEPAEALVARLARAKAEAVAASHPGALVIGSDQVAVNGDQVLGKPGGFDAAVAQLRQASGKRVSFLTGLCLWDTRDGGHQVEVIPYHVQFRDLTTAQIEAYVARERPFNCAGSFKSEGLGIALFERLEGDDPNALIGLPLIRLVRMLTNVGIEVLKREDETPISAD